ncbi:Arc family DNA-binding protein [Ectopseudomonas khazarica]
MKQMTRTQIRLPSELMEWVKQQARDQNRSMNSQLVEILTQLKRQAA